MDNKNFKWYPFVLAIFVSSLIVSNIIAGKLTNIFGLYLPAAVILFPVVYILGDVLTEVYGFERARRVIWIGFFCNLLVVLAIWVAGLLTPAPFWNANGVYTNPEDAQQAYQAILGFTPRLLVASFVAYLIGEFLNSIVLAKLKVRTAGRFLWLRTISSTIIGQGADSAIFITVAFLGILNGGDLQRAIISQWLFKVGYEVLATPLTYLVVNGLKRVENVDHFDQDTNFNPIGFS